MKSQKCLDGENGIRWRLWKKKPTDNPCFEKTYGKLDREALLQVLGIFEEGDNVICNIKLTFNPAEHAFGLKELGDVRNILSLWCNIKSQLSVAD